METPARVPRSTCSGRHVARYARRGRRPAAGRSGARARFSAVQASPLLLGCRAGLHGGRTADLLSARGGRHAARRGPLGRVSRRCHHLAAFSLHAPALAHARIRTRIGRSSGGCIVYPLLQPRPVHPSQCVMGCASVSGDAWLWCSSIHDLLYGPPVSDRAASPKKRTHRARRRPHLVCS